MINGYVVGGIVLAFSIATVTAYVKGRDDGAELEKAAQIERRELVREARDAAANAAADAIAAIEVKHVTIRQEVQREILEKPIYRDCRHDPRGLQLINAALGFPDVPAGQGELPAADPAN